MLKRTAVIPTVLVFFKQDFFHNIIKILTDIPFMMYYLVIRYSNIIEGTYAII